MEQYLKQGLISDSKVLDIRQVEVRCLPPLRPATCIHCTPYLVGYLRKDPR